MQLNSTNPSETYKNYFGHALELNQITTIMIMKVIILIRLNPHKISHDYEGYNAHSIKRQLTSIIEGTFELSYCHRRCLNL